MNNLKSIIWGLVLITLGIIIGLNAFEIINVNIFFDGWWTLFIIVPCFIGIITEENKLENIIGLIIGIGLLLWRRDVIEIGMLWKLIVPIILILVGISCIFKGKIDKKMPWIIMGLSIVNVLIMSFMIIPVALLVKSNIQFSFKEAVNLYKNSSISLNIVQDCLLSLVLSLLGSYAIGTVINKKVMLNVNKVKLFSSDNKEKQEYKEVAINATKSIFEKLEATDEAKAVKKEDLIEQINNKNAKEYINYLYSLRIIKKYKGKYYYCEEAESNIKIHYAYWKGAIAIAIAAVSIACILFSFGLISQSKKKVYNNDVSFSIDNTWNEYKVNQSTEDDETTVEKTWRYYKYMNANEVLAGNEEHSYPETITVSYGDNNFGKEIELNDLRDLFEGYFYEYMGFDNYQIEVLTTDNGYETLEIMLGYEDAMVFDYYLINGNKMAFISASTYSNDENLYDSLEEYTKEVVNSFKWNE